MASSVVRTERLTKDFVSGFWRARTHRALDGLSIDVPEGSVFGLLGPNGAGKSTTLKLLLNLLFPTSGSCELLGRPPSDASTRYRVGFLPEYPAPYGHLTAEELLSYYAGLFGLRGHARKQRSATVLDRVGIGADRRRPIREYSKGMLQRVGVAQALVNDPELILLDEPMAGLDPIGRRDLCDLLLDLRRQGRTIIFSSHILSDVEKLCTRVAILSRGRLCASGTLAELSHAHGGGTLEDVFLDVVGSAPEPDLP